MKKKNVAYKIRTYVLGKVKADASYSHDRVHVNNRKETFRPLE